MSQEADMDQRQQPGRDKPDFAALAQQFTQWAAEDLDIIWDRNDELSSVRDFKFFLLYCKQHQLNPVAGEVVGSMRFDSIKRKMVMTPIVKIGVLRRRRALECDGIDEAKFTYEGTALVSAAGSIYRKGSAKPFSTTVYYKEYAPLTNSGHVVSHWRDKPHIMLGACLEAQLTRIAFFDLCGDFLTDEETQTRPASTMDDPTPEDDARVSALAGKVGVKAPPPAPAPVETPAPASETKPVEPVRPADSPAPVEPAATETKVPDTETSPPATETKPAVTETKQPAGETAAVSPIRQRMEDVIAKFGQTQKSGQSTFNSFTRGFLATDTLPKKAEIYGPIIDKLEAGIKDPAWLKALIEDPKQAGSIASGKGPDAVDAYATKNSWDPESVKILREIATAWKLGPKETVEWCDDLQLHLESPENVRVFLKIAALTPKAHLILAASRKYKLSIRVLAENLSNTFGAPLQDVPAQKLDKALELMDGLLAGQVKSSPAAAQPEDFGQEEMPF